MTDPGDDGEIPLLSLAEDSIVTTSEESDNVTTPLPKLQIGILMLVLLAEPISSQCIYPFINQVTHCFGRTWRTPDEFQLISELGITGGDEKKVGYYAGEQQRLRAINGP